LAARQASYQEELTTQQASYQEKLTTQQAGFEEQRGCLEAGFEEQRGRLEADFQAERSKLLAECSRREEALWGAARAVEGAREAIELGFVLHEWAATVAANRKARRLAIKAARDESYALHTEAIRAVGVLSACLAAWAIAAKRALKETFREAAHRWEHLTENVVVSWAASENAQAVSACVGAWRLLVAGCQLAAELEVGRRERIALGVHLLEERTIEREEAALGAIMALGLRVWADLAAEHRLARALHRALSVTEAVMALWGADQMFNTVSICFIWWQRVVTYQNLQARAYLWCWRQGAQAQAEERRNGERLVHALRLWNKDQGASRLKVVWERWREVIIVDRELDLRKLCVEQVQRAQQVSDASGELMQRHSEEALALAILQVTLSCWSRLVLAESAGRREAALAEEAGRREAALAAEGGAPKGATGRGHASSVACEHHQRRPRPRAVQPCCLAGPVAVCQLAGGCCQVPCLVAGHRWSVIARGGGDLEACCPR